MMSLLLERKMEKIQKRLIPKKRGTCNLQWKKNSHIREEEDYLGGNYSCKKKGERNL